MAVITHQLPRKPRPHTAKPKTEYMPCILLQSTDACFRPRRSRPKQYERSEYMYHSRLLYSHNHCSPPTVIATRLIATGWSSMTTRRLVPLSETRFIKSHNSSFSVLVPLERHPRHSLAFGSPSVLQVQYAERVASARVGSVLRMLWLFGILVSGNKSLKRSQREQARPRESVVQQWSMRTSSSPLTERSCPVTTLKRLEHCSVVVLFSLLILYFITILTSPSTTSTRLRLL